MVDECGNGLTDMKRIEEREKFAEFTNLFIYFSWMIKNKFA